MTLDNWIDVLVEKIIGFKSECSDEKVLDTPIIKSLKMESVMEDYFFHIPEEAQELHNKIYKKIQHYLPGVPQLNVYSRPGIKQIAESITNFGMVVVHPRLAELDNNYLELRVFEFLNQDASIENLFGSIITHEYVHYFYDRSMRSDIEKINVDTDRRELEAFSEAFVFWYSEKISGYINLYEELAEKYNRKLDVRLMKAVYKDLDNIAKHNSVQYVVDNYKKIVKERYLGGIKIDKNVRLPQNPIIQIIKNENN